MNFKEWLTEQIAEIGIDPTSLSRLVDGLNQPTVQRVISGETKNPGIGTVTKIRAAIDIARASKGMPIETDLPPLAEPLVSSYSAMPLKAKTRAEKVGESVSLLPDSSPLLDAIEAMLKGVGVGKATPPADGYIAKAIQAGDSFEAKRRKRRTGTS